MALIDQVMPSGGFFLSPEATTHIEAVADALARHLTYQNAAFRRIDVPGCTVRIGMLRIVPETVVLLPGEPTGPPLSSSTALLCLADGSALGQWDPLDPASSLPVTTMGRMAKVLRVFYTRFALTFGAEMALPDIGDVTPDEDDGVETGNGWAHTDHLI